jgi:hypothetical protein
MISDLLSALVVEATGQLIFGESSEPSGPTQWLNHDIVARRLNASHLQWKPSAPSIAEGSKDSQLEVA